MNIRTLGNRIDLETRKQIWQESFSDILPLNDFLILYEKYQSTQALFNSLLE